MVFDINSFQTKVFRDWAYKAFADRKVKLTEIKELDYLVRADGKIDKAEVNDARSYAALKFPLQANINGKVITVEKKYDQDNAWAGEEILQKFMCLIRN